MRFWRPNTLYWKTISALTTGFILMLVLPGLFCALLKFVIDGWNAESLATVILWGSFFIAVVVAIVLMYIHMHHDYSPFYSLDEEHMENSVALAKLRALKAKHQQFLLNTLEEGRRLIATTNPLAQFMFIYRRILHIRAHR